MDDERFERWVASLTIRGGEAYLPGETYRADKRRHRYHQQQSPERRAYRREWQRRYRERLKKEAQHESS